ncbi:MAG: pyridoxamine 5'-phosphate oxidase family protein [Candidatus Zixiibacteriota bacterium]
MRRKEKKIDSIIELGEILENGRICRIAMIDNGVPYIIPLCYGYEDGYLYFHTAPEGKKIDLILENQYIGFEIDIAHELITDEIAGKWTMKYKSISGNGRAELVGNYQDKIDAYRVIMEQFSGSRDWNFAPGCIDASLIIKLEIMTMTGKKSGY